MRFRLYVVSLVMAFPAMFCQAAGVPKPIATETKLCGIYAVKAVLEAAGISADIDQLLVQENISSNSGSTTDDICRMLRANGIQAIATGGATRFSIESTGNLAILNLKARAGASCSGHWVAFLGVNNGEVVLYDHARTHRVYKIRFADLMTRWDGASIICLDRDSAQNSVSIVVSRACQFAPRLLLVVICMGLLAISNRNRSRTRISRFLFATVIAASVAFGWQIMDSSSLLRNFDSAKWMAADTQDNATIPRCERPYNEILDEQRPFVVVDARPSPYCHFQTLPGAKLAGIDLHLDEVRRDWRTLKRIPRLLSIANRVNVNGLTLLRSEFVRPGSRTLAYSCQE